MQRLFMATNQSLVFNVTKSILPILRHHSNTLDVRDVTALNESIQLQLIENQALYLWELNSSL